MSHASSAPRDAARVKQAARTPPDDIRPTRPRPESSTVTDTLAALPLPDLITWRERARVRACPDE